MLINAQRTPEAQRLQGFQSRTAVCVLNAGMLNEGDVLVTRPHAISVVKLRCEVQAFDETLRGNWLQMDVEFGDIAGAGWIYWTPGSNEAILMCVFPDSVSLVVGGTYPCSVSIFDEWAVTVQSEVVSAWVKLGMSR